jgi:hypothetical protein
MSIPKLSPEERAEALKRAAEARQKCAAFRKEISDGHLTAEAALSDEYRLDPAIGRIRVASFVKAFPGIGPVRAASMMEEAGVAETRRLRGLGRRQVDKLKVLLATD